MKNRDTISSKVSDFINKYIGHSEDAYRKELSIDYLLLELQITKIEYYWELSITSENDFQFHLKKDTNYCFINNYNLVLFKEWQASTDFQTVYKYFKTVSYMAAYFSKSENPTSEANCSRN